MIKELLHVDGPVIGLLDKLGQLIVLSVLWLLGCVPLVTIGTSTAALYYAVIKAVRRGRGSASREFFRSYRANLGRGICVSVICLLLTAFLLFLMGQERRWLGQPAFLGLVLTLLVGVFLAPVLSRFSVGVGRVWKLALLMAFRFPHYALLLLVGGGLLGLLQIFVLPMPVVLILPGAACWLATFPLERVLRSFMPEKEENDNAWYYEN